MKKGNDFGVGFFSGILVTLLCVGIVYGAQLVQDVGSDTQKIKEYREAPPVKRKEAPQVAAPAPTPKTIANLEGSPSDGVANAKIQLVEFSDFHCPFCSRVTPTINQLMKEYEGRIQRIWKHYPLPFHQGADKTHEASSCANDQGKFWEFHREAFDRQKELRDATTINQIAQDIGLDEAVFNDCLQSGKYAGRVAQDMRDGQAVGVSGTPAVFVNGLHVSGARPYAYFKAVIDHVLDPQNNPNPIQQQAPAVREQAPPPAAKVELTDLKGKVFRGPEDAEITLVEFSDFHCPFCKRAFGTVEALMQKYAGKVKHVWRHYPLPFHQGAVKTHAASECAREQGKFWEFKDSVFERQSDIKNEGVLEEIASGLGLDMQAFTTCVESGRFEAFVNQEVAAGKSVGVSGTPTFFVNGNRIVGAQPIQIFEKYIEEELSN